MRSTVSSRSMSVSAMSASCAQNARSQNAWERRSTTRTDRFSAGAGRGTDARWQISPRVEARIAVVTPRVRAHAPAEDTPAASTRKIVFADDDLAPFVDAVAPELVGHQGSRRADD